MYKRSTLAFIVSLCLLVETLLAHLVHQLVVQVLGIVGDEALG